MATTAEPTGDKKPKKKEPPPPAHDDHGHGDHDHPEFLAHHFDTPQQQFDAGKLGIWLFLAQEVLFFAGLFCAYTVYRAQHPEIFVWAHYYLDTTWGAINTAVLIVSSLTAAWAVRNAQLAQHRALIVNIVITIACAFTFLGVKYVEYSHKFHDGLLWGKNFNPAEEVWELHTFKEKHPESAEAAEKLHEAAEREKKLAAAGATAAAGAAAPAGAAKPVEAPKPDTTAAAPAEGAAAPVEGAAPAESAAAEPPAAPAGAEAAEGAPAAAPADAPAEPAAEATAAAEPGVPAPAGGLKPGKKPAKKPALKQPAKKAAAKKPTKPGQVAAEAAPAEVASAAAAEGEAPAAVPAEPAAAPAGESEAKPEAAKPEAAKPEDKEPTVQQLLASYKPEVLEPLFAAGVLGKTSEGGGSVPARPRGAWRFFGIYFFMTGLHGIHVIAGIIVWVWLLLRALKKPFGPQYFGPIDYAALYWHLVDLIWIYLFPLLYLIH